MKSKIPHRSYHSIMYFCKISDRLRYGAKDPGSLEERVRFQSSRLSPVCHTGLGWGQSRNRREPAGDKRQLSLVPEFQAVQFWRLLPW